VLQADFFSKGLTEDFSAASQTVFFFTKDAFKAVKNSGSGIKKVIQPLARF
jgi:hypothetical protein